MAKRTKTDSAAVNPRDFWPTPMEAVPPLVERLKVTDPNGLIIEPCAGDGRLADALTANGLKVRIMSDIEPRRDDVRRGDASKLPFAPTHLVVTNPPWSRDLLEPILHNMVGKTNAWLLLPLDYLANLWMAPFVPYVNQIVPLGRVSWLNNGKGGYENSAWLRFNWAQRNIVAARKPKPRTRKASIPNPQGDS